jgi:hypothetical protein
VRRFVTTLAAVAALGLPVLTAQVAAGAPSSALHVAPGGTGTDCSAANPCGSIGAALLRAGAGQEIHLRSGVYVDQQLRDPSSGQVRPTGARAVVRPADGANVLLAGRTWIAAARVELRDVEITGVLAVVEPSHDVRLDGLSGRQAMVQLRGGSEITLTNSTLGGNVDADLVQIGGNRGPAGLTDVTVSNNVLVDATDSAPLDALHIDCLQVFGPVRSLEVSGNRIAGCANSPVMIKSNIGAVRDVRFTRNAIQECVPRREACYSHYAVQVNVGSGGPVSGFVLENNTIDGGLLTHPGVDLSAVANLISDPTGRNALSAPCIAGAFVSNVISRHAPCAERAAQNRIADPVYADRSIQSLAPSGSSPGVDQGGTATWPDLAGRSAPCGPVDAGAIEYCGTTPVSTVPPTTAPPTTTPVSTTPVSTTPVSTTPHHGAPDHGTPDHGTAHDGTAHHHAGLDHAGLDRATRTGGDR